MWASSKSTHAVKTPLLPIPNVKLWQMKNLNHLRRGQKQINLFFSFSFFCQYRLCMMDKRTDPIGAHSGSRRYTHRKPWISAGPPLAAWLPRTRSTEEDKPSAIHTAAWRNGVGLLRCCLGNDAYSFPPCTLGARCSDRYPTSANLTLRD